MRISDWSSDVCSSDLLNGLASGLTLAKDATGDEIFRVGGSKLQTGWATEWRIEGGAYSVLKSGGAFVRKHPDIAYVYNSPGGAFLTNYRIAHVDIRWEERRVGKACVRTCKFRG